MLKMRGLGAFGGLVGLGGLKKADGPNKKKKNFVTHLMTMPQAAGKEGQKKLCLYLMYAPLFTYLVKCLHNVVVFCARCQFC